MTIERAIAVAIKECGGNVEEGVRRAIKLLREDRASWDEYVDLVVRKALRDTIHAQLTKASGPSPAGHRLGRALTSPSTVPTAPSVPRASLLRGYDALASDELLAYRLRNGKPLASATKREVLAEADYHEQLGHVHRAYTVWFRMIAEVLVDHDQAVSTKFTEASLQSLRKIAGERIR